METVTLKEYFERILEEKDKAINIALAAAKESVIKAENAAERRFELLNELRQGVATKEQLEALDKVVDDLKTSRDSTEGKRTIIMVLVSMFISVIVGIAVVFLNRSLNPPTPPPVLTQPVPPSSTVVQPVTPQ